MAIVLPRNLSGKLFAEVEFQDINPCASFPYMSKCFRSGRYRQEQEDSIARVFPGQAGGMCNYRLWTDNDSKMD